MHSTVSHRVSNVVVLSVSNLGWFTQWWRSWRNRRSRHGRARMWRRSGSFWWSSVVGTIRAWHHAGSGQIGRHWHWASFPHHHICHGRIRGIRLGKALDSNVQSSQRHELIHLHLNGSAFHFWGRFSRAAFDLGLVRTNVAFFGHTTL